LLDPIFELDVLHDLVPFGVVDKDFRPAVFLMCTEDVQLLAVDGYEEVLDVPLEHQLVDEVLVSEVIDAELFASGVAQIAEFEGYFED
jgi:predicted nucleotidyltransferase